MATFDLESYATVQERIAQFYQDFPDGSIRTFMIVRDGPEVIFEARAYRNPEEAAMGIYTSGWAREIEGKSPVNKTSHLENAESSAVGRALSNLGYATDARRPSRSEMIKVARMKDEHEEMLQFIRTTGPRVADDASIEINAQRHNLKEFVRKNWTTIKEQFRIARLVVDALEAAAETSFGGEQKEAA
jgi:predicted ester cyclase